MSKPTTSVISFQFLAETSLKCKIFLIFGEQSLQIYLSLEHDEHYF